MPDKVTYILGAGASIGAFPLVKGAPHHTQHNGLGLAESLLVSGSSLKSKYQTDPSLNQIAKAIGDAMIDIGTRAKSFGNVDSYAKFLFLTKKHFVLSSLKTGLAYYFIRQQVCKEYSSKKIGDQIFEFYYLLATKEFQFPSHVKILNWNYDFLLGLASMEYVTEIFKEEKGAITATVAPFVKYAPSIGLPVKGKHIPLNNSYSLVYLNGIAGYYGDVDGFEQGFFKNIIVELLDGDINREITEDELLSQFVGKFSKFHSLITFAWEGELKDNHFLGNRLENAISMATGTDILVAVGYSFPFYNREFDNVIFETMKPTLKKIYFQDPLNDGLFLRRRYGLTERVTTKNYAGVNNDKLHIHTSGVDIEHIQNTDQFYIPIEV